MPGRLYNSSNYRYGFNGKENDNEVKGVGNQQDYGMRIYDPRLGRWLSIDNRMKDYPSITPYAFAVNSPIALKDADGNVVVDANGNPVTVTVNQGKDGKYTASFTFAKGTSQEVMNNFKKNAGTVIQAMSNTEVGRGVVKSMVDAQHNVCIVIDKSGPKYFNKKTNSVVDKPGDGATLLYGLTEPTLKDGKLASTKITIYEGSIDKIKNETGPNDVYMIGLKDKVVAQSDFSKEEIIGATGTHEGTHATDKNSLRATGGKDVESKPEENELKHYEELDTKNPQKYDRVIDKPKKTN